MSRNLIDLAILETYRRSELEDRVSKFAQVCDTTIAHIQSLKATAQNLVNELNCDPDLLKDSFLSCMSQVDEYNYVVSEFQLSLGKFGPLNNVVMNPEQDTKAILKPTELNLMDLLTEPSTSRDSTQNQPKVLTKAEKIKLDSSFIIFSNSNSISSIAETASETVDSMAITANNSDTQVNDSNRQKDNSDRELVDPCEQTAASHGSGESDRQSIDLYEECVASQSPVINAESEGYNSENEMVPSREHVVDSHEPVHDLYGQELHNSSGVRVDGSETVLRSQISDVAERVRNVSLQDWSSQSVKQFTLPAANILEIDIALNAVIVHVEQGCFYIITESLDEVLRYGEEMTTFYTNNKIRNAIPDELSGFKYCAFYDSSTKAFYRALTLNDRDGNMFSLYLVDTGEKQWYPLECIYPLMPQFCSTPPYARCCQLSRVELPMTADNEIVQRVYDIMKEYTGKTCVVTVDDNVSDILAVTVYLKGNMTLNQLVLCQVYSSGIKSEAGDSDYETEDALVAATGYHNRDEATNCEYATRGENCPRGERCKKTHHVLFPDGWTRDRVEVVARLPELPMPPVGATVGVHVIHVCHFDRVYVHLLDNKPEELPPKFGEDYYPTTLTALVRDMNIQPQRLCYKPLELEPAPGEIVAALYPLDGQIYRANVVSVSRLDQTLQVRFVDYGNTMWVRSRDVFRLSAAHCVLPAQAMLARLAHISPLRFDNRHLTYLQERFKSLVYNKRLKATIVDHENDEMLVRLEDDGGFNIGLEMARLGLVLYSEEGSKTSSQAPQKPIMIPG